MDEDKDEAIHSVDNSKIHYISCYCLLITAEFVLGVFCGLCG